MTTAAAIGPKSTYALLETACSRNQSAELHCECDHQSLVARLRLLRLDPDQICTDAPQFTFGSAALTHHQHVLVHLTIEGAQYMFRSRVANPRLVIALNAETRILGMALRVPHRMEKQQRRADFRVSVAAQQLPIRFRSLERAENAARSSTAERPFEGRITNISGGGVGTIVEYSQRDDFALGRQYVVEFVLPGIDEPFAFDAEVRNFRNVPETKTHVVGLRFLPAVDPSARTALAQITRFVVAQQRRELQMRK